MAPKDSGPPPLLLSVVKRFLTMNFSEWSVAEQQRLCHLVGDAVGCAVAGASADVVVQFRKALESISFSDPSDSRMKVEPIAAYGAVSVGVAAALNTCMIRQLDLMDVFWDKDVCHPSEVVGAAFAFGAGLGSSGADVLAAIGAAYEFQVALSRLAAYSAHGLHHVSAAGFIVPMVYARLSGMSADKAIHAAALGGTRSNVLGVLSRGRLSSAKSLAYGLSAMEALTDVALAEAGLTGPVGGLDWYLGSIAGVEVSSDRFAQAASGAILAVSLKQFPAQFALQGPIEAAIAAAADAPPRARPVLISVQVPASTIARTTDCGKLRPDNRETADHSLYACVAMAVADGVVSVEGMFAERWRAEEVMDLADCIRVSEAPELATQNPGGGPARVVIEWSDGSMTERTVVHPHGDARNSFDGLTFRRKFMSLTVPTLGEPQSMRLWGLLMNLPAAAGLSDVMTATRTP